MEQYLDIEVQLLGLQSIQVIWLQPVLEER